MDSVVILTIKAYSLALNAVLYKADGFVECYRWLVGNIHLQVDTTGPAAKGVLKCSSNHLPTYSLAAEPGRSKNSPHHHFVM